MTGDLTIRGVTRPVTLEVEALPPAIHDPWGNARRGVSARARINRKDWGLSGTWRSRRAASPSATRSTIEIDAEITRRKD